MSLLTEGLPIYRQERGTGEDIIAGEAFLTMLMGPRAHRSRSRYSDRRTTVSIPSPFVREVRSSTLYTTPRILTEKPSDNANRVNSNLDFSDNNESSANRYDGTILSMRVSSSVEQAPNEKPVTESNALSEEDYIETTTETPTTFETIVVASEEHQSLNVEANKSVFSVEEAEPITTNSESNGYESLPSPLPLTYSPIFNTNTKSYPGTVIYHLNPRENNRARSVSYSTVIQNIPNEQKSWNDQYKHHNMSNTERKLTTPSIETKEYYATNKYNPSEYSNPDKRKEWNYESSSQRYYETTERNYESTQRYYETSERNWDGPKRNYEVPAGNSPLVYAQPEQNYEVDEAVSVQTNGRTHGVQPARTDDSKLKKDDNKKVGYVVEGRNYRKYRVEERTSDGFIVGEYGVVSHDDGSLRGVRYTADGTINPRLIYDALMKFLSL